MRWKFLIFLMVLLIPLINAETSFYVPQNTNYTIKFSCETNGYYCSAAADCNITINYPNSTTMVDNIAAENLNNGYFGYNLSNYQTSVRGEYFSRVTCQDGLLNDTSTFIYEVNPSGIRSTSERSDSVSRMVYFIFGIGILLFIGFLFLNASPPVKWTFFIFAAIFFLIGLNILFVGLQEEVVNPKIEAFFDSFTAISFIMFYFLGAFLIIMWFFTILNTYFYKKTLSKMQRFGNG